MFADKTLKTIAPAVIEAFKYDGDLYNRNMEFYVPEWAEKAYKDEIICFDSGEEPAQCFIKTLEGNMLVSVGDYVLQGVQGELYPCKPDIFEATYEAIN